MFGKFVGEIAVCGIRLKLGKYVPYSGQEHTANSDNRFLVPAARFYSAITFPKFGVVFGFDKRVCDLYKDRLEKRSGTGYSCGFDLLCAAVVARTTAAP